MIKYGRSIRWFEEYGDEVAFSRQNGFDFMQVWYTRAGIVLDKVPEPREKTIKDYGFPVIFHALLDINEFEEQLPRLLEVLKYLSQDELIIHPICESEEINEETIFKLCDKVSWAYRLLSAEGIALSLENNSKLDPIHYTAEDIRTMFSQNTEIELLLDIAHMDSYEQLQEIVRIKKPKILHIADKHFDIIHEHLPVGRGDIDFRRVFEEILPDFEGKIIFEVVAADGEIIDSRKAIKSILNTNIK